MYPQAQLYWTGRTEGWMAIEQGAKAKAKNFRWLTPSIPAED
jgi:hypothetical protein